MESVRRVTQVNQGKLTPGIDKAVVTTPEARTELCKKLSQLELHKVYPVRRVYIPKRKGKRPLGIPTIEDRCVQAMVKNALEPFWEARFEGVSYGFRPGRGCHNAIEKIFRLARPNTRRPWILDADIEGTFDNIGHSALQKIIANFPARPATRGRSEGDSSRAVPLDPVQGGSGRLQVLGCQNSEEPQCCDDRRGQRPVARPRVP
jgi:RNA-directed DNA polymerase